MKKTDRSFWDSQRRGRLSTGRGKPAVSWYHPRFEPLECRYVLSAVVGAYLFYDNSAFDGGVIGINPGDVNAIADKTPYRPNGSTALYSAVSSYSRGINGIMIDLSAGGSHAAITASDFVFTVGNSNSPGSWIAAPAPSGLSVSMGGGIGGADRVEITWATGNIANKWLEVQVLNTPNTGLATTDVFFWGNKIGDSGTSPPADSFVTNTTDAAQVNATLTAAGGASITNLRDYNRSGAVDTTDAAIVNASLGTITRIALTLSPPALSAALSNDTGPGGVPNADGITTDPAVAGTLTPAASISSFTARLNSDPVATSVLSTLQMDGSFTISESLLATVHGVGSLADGSYVLHLRARDAEGTTTVADVPFVLKRSIATPGMPDLASSSDTGASDTDNITKINTPDISVAAEAGSTVTLYVDGSPVGSQLANPTAQFTLSALADGVHTIRAAAVDGAGNTSALSPPLAVTIDTVAPVVTLSSLVTFGDDLTPHITVTASDAPALANGTQIRVDVDLNNDGDFDDANESNRTLSTLYAGSRYFEVTPALPPTDAIAGPYLIQMRARVTDLAGNEGTSPRTSHKIDTLPNVDVLGNNALQRYINNGDLTYANNLPTLASTIVGENLIGDPSPDYTVYVFNLKTQTWRTAAEVTNTVWGDAVWQHWLQIIVPTTLTKSTALLMVNSGSTSSTAPTTLSDTMKSLGAFAVAQGMIAVNLPNDPSQALHFADDPPGVNRTEDEIISYTFNKFVNNIGAPNNDTWPALLPMVKSAVRAMDAVQLKDTTLPGGINVEDFIVTGFSKRGWTTWLTGAADSRVKAVIPGVIDLLNLDESFVHHYNFYGFFAPAVQDYQSFHLIEDALKPANQELGRIVDPYRYLNNSNLTNIPKLLLNSTGDEFFVPDSAQFYYSDIPGTKYLRYIPNTGHGLNSTEVSNSTRTFANAVVNNLALPQYSWTIDPDGAIRVTTPSSPTSVLVWQATNPNARDFRNAYTGLVWSSSPATNLGGGVYVGNVLPPDPDPPPLGASAFMIELTFTSPIVGIPYKFTTEVRVASNLPYVSWTPTYFMPTNPPPPAPGSAAMAILGDEENAVAFGLAVGIKDSTTGPSPAVLAAPTDAAAIAQSRDLATAQILDEWPWIDEDRDAAGEASDAETFDLALAGLDSELGA